MTSKQIIVDLNKDEKLNGANNHDIWNLKVVIILEDQETTKVLTQVLNPPPLNGNAIQNRCAIKSFESWKKITP